MKIYLAPEQTGQPIAERLEIAAADKKLAQAALRAAMDEAGKAAAVLAALLPSFETNQSYSILHPERAANEDRVASYLCALSCINMDAETPTTFTSDSEVPAQIVHEGIMAGIGQLAQDEYAEPPVNQILASLEYVQSTS